MSWEYAPADWREGTVYAAHERDARAMRAPGQPRIGSAKVRRFASVKDAAAILGVSEQRVRLLLIQHRIKGARRVRGAWRIPLVHMDGRWTVRATTGRRGPQAAYSDPRDGGVPF